MNGKEKLKGRKHAETAKISLVPPVRGCCLSTPYREERKEIVFRILSLLPWVLVNF